MAVRRDKTGRWRFRVTVQLPDGSKQRIGGCPFNANTQAAAEHAEREAIARALAGARNPAQKEVPTFRGFAEEFQDTYVKANNKPAERKAKEMVLRTILVPTFGERRLDEVRMRDVEQLKARLRADEYAPKTINNVLTILGRMLRYAQEIEVLDSVPRIKFVKVTLPPVRFLEHAELERLLDAARPDPELLAAILCACDAGLRAGEVRALTWGDLDLRARLLTVQRTDWRGQLGTPKGGRIRTIPMTARLAAALKKHRHLIGDAVFCTADGRRTRHELDWKLKLACRKAGIRWIGWHSLRHTFASHLAMKGVPPRSIQDLLGHTTLTMTLRYLHLFQGAARAAIDALEGQGPWQNRGKSTTDSEDFEESSVVTAEAQGNRTLRAPLAGSPDRL